MKKIVLIFLSLFTFTSKAQFAVLDSSLNSPTSIAKKGDSLFVTGNFLDDRIGLIDLQSTNPTANTFLSTGLLEPTGIAIYGDRLFYGQFKFTGPGGLYEIDLTQSNPSPTQLFPTILDTSIWDMTVNGNLLYFSTRTNLMSFDLTSSSTTLSAISLPFIAFGFVFNGTDVYLTDGFSNGNVWKMDISSPNPIAIPFMTGFSKPHGIVLNNNYLYVAEFQGDIISRIDLSQNPPIKDTLISNLSNPNGLYMDQGDLYVAELRNYNGRVLRIPNSIVGLDQIKLKEQTFRAYPNPSEGYLSIVTTADLIGETIQLIDLNGKTIYESQISKSIQELNFEAIESGMYFIKVGSRTEKVFFK